MTVATRWSPSVTVAAIVEQGGRYLLVEEHTPEGLMLNNPAGHLDPGESTLQGVVREALEETQSRPNQFSKADCEKLAPSILQLRQLDDELADSK